jgi:alcohol dehydrogenase, propanol-preferring
VLVIGVGGVGSFVVQFAKLAGANVIAAERSEKLAWARQLGADAVATPESVADDVRGLTRGAGVDCVLDIVGSRDSLAAGVAALRPGGRLVLVGYTPDEYPLSAKQFAQSEFELIGSRGGSRCDLQAAVDCVAGGAVKSIVTQRRPLSQVNEALADLRSGRVLGRLVLEPES